MALVEREDIKRVVSIRQNHERGVRHTNVQVSVAIHDSRAAATSLPLIGSSR